MAKKPSPRLLRAAAPPEDALTEVLREHVHALGLGVTVTTRWYNRAAQRVREGASLFELRRVLLWSRDDWQESRVYRDPFRVLRPSVFRLCLVRAENS